MRFVLKVRNRSFKTTKRKHLPFHSLDQQTQKIRIILFIYQIYCNCGFWIQRYYLEYRIVKRSDDSIVNDSFKITPWIQHIFLMSFLYERVSLLAQLALYTKNHQFWIQKCIGSRVLCEQQEQKQSIKQEYESLKTTRKQVYLILQLNNILLNRSQAGHFKYYWNLKIQFLQKLSLGQNQIFASKLMLSPMQKFNKFRSSKLMYFGCNKKQCRSHKFNFSWWNFKFEMHEHGKADHVCIN